MGYIRIPTNFFANPDVAELSNDARLLFLAGLAFSSARLTDGRLRRGAVRIACAYADAPASAIDELVDAGFWRAVDDGYEVADYLGCVIARSPRAQDLMRRAWQAMARTIRPVILARDGGACRRCGSVARLHIDHIYPIAAGGTNDYSNLQVLCRPCNLRKGARVDGVD